MEIMNTKWMKGFSENRTTNRNPLTGCPVQPANRRNSKLVLFYLILLALLSPLFYSCDADEENYSIGDIWISMGFINKPQSTESFTVILDSGDTLVPVANAVPYFKINDSLRVMVNYTILDEVEESTQKYYVKINNLYDVLYKGIIELTNEDSDSIGNDPVQIDDIWINNNLLNIEFRYIGGEMIHFINLIRTEGDVAKAPQPIELEIRHNARNDQQRYTMQSIVTFDLKNIQIPGQDSVQFIVSSTDYKGDKHTFNSTYYY
jgi:hypothetical protein